MIKSVHCRAAAEIAGFPRRQRQNLTRAVPEGPVRRCQRLKPRAHFGVRRAIDQEEAGADRRQILDRLAGIFVGGDLIVSGDCGLGIGARQFGGLAQAGQDAIAGRTVGDELGEGGFRLLMLASLDKGRGLLESGTRSGSLLGLPPLIAAPARDAHDDEHAQRDEIYAVSLPQLLELFATDFLVDFVENIAHGTRPNPNSPRRSRITATTGPGQAPNWKPAVANLLLHTGDENREFRAPVLGPYDARGAQNQRAKPSQQAS